MIQAIFEESPYKFWMHGNGGTMHVGLKGQMFDPDEDMCVATTPNDVAFYKTWDKFVWEYLGTTGDVVLHNFTDEYDEFERKTFIEEVNTYAHCRGKVAFRFMRIPGHDGSWCDMQVIPFGNIDHESLFDLMHLLYDTPSLEWWECGPSTDWETKNIGFVTDNYDEILHPNAA